MRTQHLFVVLGAVTALVGACAGRSTDEPTDAVELNGDVKIDVNHDIETAGGDTNGSETVTPTGSIIETAQKSDGSVNCPATSTIGNFETALTGDVVVVTPKFIASKDKTTGAAKLDGYFVATSGLLKSQAYNGVELTVDSALQTNFQPGDVVNITADHLEFYCMTEFKATAVTASGTSAVPLPVTVNAADIGSQTADTAEPYEGVLVRVANVSVTNANPDGPTNDYGAFQITGGLTVANTFCLNYMNKATDQRKVGDEFEEIIGVVNYSYGVYVLVPRTNADLVLKTGGSEGTAEQAEVVEDVIEATEITPNELPDVPPTNSTIEQIQDSDNSKTCANSTGFGDFETGLDFEAVVLSDKLVLSKTKLDGYYVSTKGLTTTQAWNGILLSVPVTLPTSFVPGDVVHVTGGKHTEFFCETEIAPTALVKAGTADLPTAVEVAASGVGNDAVAMEPWEGVWITVTNATVTNAQPDATDYGNMKIDGGLWVKKPVGFAAPAVGDTFKSIRGFVHFTYGNFVLVTSSDADFVAGTVVVEPTPEVNPEPTPDVYETVQDIVETTPEVPAEVTEVVADTTPTDVNPDVVATQTSTAALQGGTASTNCTAEGNTTITASVELGPVVVLSPKTVIGKDATTGVPYLDGYYVTDQTGGGVLGTGLLVTLPTSLATNFVPGDVLSVAGDYKEFFCMTEVTLTTKIGSVSKTGTTATPAPLAMASSLLESGGTKAATEPYAGLIVKVTLDAAVNITSITKDGADNTKAFWFTIGNGIAVDNDFGVTGFTPAVGTHLKSITGALKYTFLKFRLEPRTLADLEQ